MMQKSKNLELLALERDLVSDSCDHSLFTSWKMGNFLMNWGIFSCTERLFSIAFANFEGGW